MGRHNYPLLLYPEGGKMSATLAIAHQTFVIINP